MRPSAGFLQSACAFGTCCSLKAALLCGLAETLPPQSLNARHKLLSGNRFQSKPWLAAVLEVVWEASCRVQEIGIAHHLFPILVLNGRNKRCMETAEIPRKTA